MLPRVSGLLCGLGSFIKALEIARPVQLEEIKPGMSPKVRQRVIKTIQRLVKAPGVGPEVKVMAHGFQPGVMPHRPGKYRFYFLDSRRKGACVRLDHLLVELRLAPFTAAALRMIKAGAVRCNNAPLHDHELSYTLPYTDFLLRVGDTELKVIFE